MIIWIVSDVLWMLGRRGIPANRVKFPSPVKVRLKSDALIGCWRRTKATPNNKRVHRCTIYVMAGIGQAWPGHDEGEVRRLERENENC
jgi:hypothetical protein